MKIIIFGVGFLGEKFLNYFEKAHNVIGVDEKPVSHSVLQIDALDKEKVKEFILKEKPDLVINTIALTSSVACEKNPELCRKLNYETAINILEACKEINSKIVFISSSYIFDGKKGNYSEEDVPSPENQYAVWKVEAEKEISKYENSIILRVDVMFGLDKNKIKFGKSTFEKDIIEVGYPNQIRSPLYIEDVPKVLSLLVEKNQVGIFNIAGPDKISMLNFLKKLSLLENAENKIKTVDSTGWLVKSPENSSLDISKIKNLGIEMTDFEKALELIKNNIK